MAHLGHMRLLDEAILELVIRFYPGYPGSGGKIMRVGAVKSHDQTT